MGSSPMRITILHLLSYFELGFLDAPSQWCGGFVVCYLRASAQWITKPYHPGASHLDSFTEVDPIFCESTCWFWTAGGTQDWIHWQHSLFITPYTNTTSHHNNNYYYNTNTTSPPIASTIPPQRDIAMCVDFILQHAISFSHESPSGHHHVRQPT